LHIGNFSAVILDIHISEDKQMAEEQKTTAPEAPKAPQAEAKKEDNLAQHVNLDEINLEAIYDVPLRISAVLGKASLRIHELMRMSRGSVIELDRKVGDAVDIYINDRIVARGEIVLIDNKIGITLTELVKFQGV
jgi:flagellar motor switch protein FliN/FliY